MTSSFSCFDSFYMNMRSIGFYDFAVVLSMSLRIVCRPYDEYDLCLANRGPEVHYLSLASKHRHDIRSKLRDMRPWTQPLTAFLFLAGPRLYSSWGEWHPLYLWLYGNPLYIDSPHGCSRRRVRRYRCSTTRRTQPVVSSQFHSIQNTSRQSTGNQSLLVMHSWLGPAC